MSKSNKKILISGCGLSWSGQVKKTWVNVLKAVGADVVDVGGPAVSNQWILNSVAGHVLTNPVDTVIVQLTSLGKLDVEVNPERLAELVEPDTLRNFTFKGIWPSSVSEEHPAKQLWQKWLYSPTLELQDIRIKLSLLKYFFNSKSIDFFVFLGYNIIPEYMLQSFNGLLTMPEFIIYNDYMQSEFFETDNAHNVHVPNIKYQIELARQINTVCKLGFCEKLNKLHAQQHRFRM